MFLTQKLYPAILFLFIYTGVIAQEKWPSPEIEQMYRHAEENVQKGNLRDAIIIYRQAVFIAPGKMLLCRGLGNALFLSGKYSDAEDILISYLDRKDNIADDKCYQVLAASYIAQMQYKKAETILDQGLERFPGSGLLYNELGELKFRGLDKEGSLNAMIDGIEKDPGFALNYYAAAMAYLQTNRVMWGLLYGEIYVNIAPDTTGFEQLKAVLFTGYKTMFENMVSVAGKENRDALKSAADKGFEAAIQKIFLSLTPVVSDGITTENLAMVRTRFLMDWYTNNSSRYPYSLFTWHDKLIKTGHFEIYNEWLFGKAENAGQYAAWNTFHEGDMERFIKWKKDNPLLVSGKDTHNDREIKSLFSKRKNK